MSEKNSKWRRSFRSKKVKEKQQKNHPACGTDEHPKNDPIARSGVSVPGPGLEAAGGRTHVGKAHEKKSKALGVMRKLFGKLGKGRQKSKDVKPDGPAEVQDVPTQVQSCAASGESKSQIDTHVVDSEVEKMRQKSQIPKPIHKSQPASPRPPSKTSPGSLDYRGSSSGAVPTDRYDQSHHRKSASTTHPEVRQPPVKPDSGNTPAGLRPPPRGKASPSGQRGHRGQVQTSPVVVHLEKYQTTLQHHGEGNNHNSEPPDKRNQSGVSEEMTNVRGIGVRHSLTQPRNADPCRTPQPGSQKPAPPEPTTTALPRQYAGSSYRAEDERLPSHGSTPQPRPGGPVPGEGTSSSNQSEVGEEFTFIDNESDEDESESSLSNRNKRDDKLSKSIERMAGKLSDLPPAFLNLLEAPLPARPWHPEVTSLKRPVADDDTIRPIARPTQLHRKQVPSPPAPASVIHYHVTIQGCDGLDVNVSPLPESAGTKDIATKTVYTADGRQLKRLSWVEVSPVSWTETDDKLSTACTKQYHGVDKDSSNLEIGSVTLGLDTKSTNKADFPWHSTRHGNVATTSFSDGQGVEAERQLKPPVSVSTEVTTTGAISTQSSASSAGEKQSPSRSPKNPASARPRPNFKPGQKRAAQEDAATNRKSSESSHSPCSMQTNRKRERRRKNRNVNQNEGSSQETGETESSIATLSQREMAANSSPKVQGENLIGTNRNLATAMSESSTQKESEAQTDPALAMVPPSRSRGQEIGVQSTSTERFLCMDCRNLRKTLSTGKCGHSIPSDIVAKRKADFEQLLGKNGNESTDDVTAMRVGPKTTFFKHAQCQTNTDKREELKLATKDKEPPQGSESRSRPVGRVAPSVRRSASAHSPTTPREMPEFRIGRWGLQRHWSFSSVDTEIHAGHQNLSSQSSTSSMEWETTSVDTDILTLETDRTLMETERTLREVELSIEESRRASRALRRARRELEADVPAGARRRGVSLDRGTSEREARGIHRLDNSGRFASIPVPEQSMAHNLGTPSMGTLYTRLHRRETTYDKLTRIRQNLIRVPGVLILGLHGGKIAVTMSPDRPHFEPIYRFMRDNDVYMTEYECAVLSHRYRTQPLDGSSDIRHPMISPLLVR